VFIDCWHGFAVGGWAHRRVSTSRFYWKPDLIEIGGKLAELEKDRDLDKPRAQEKLEFFRNQRKGLVDSIIQVRIFSAVSSPPSAHVHENRAAPNLRNGLGLKLRPKLRMLANEGSKDAKREYKQQSESLSWC
jgi:hypothetical protein